jgi:DNA modification methylase
MEIKPYSKNAKQHPKKQIQQIANSIKEFGMNQPIVVDKDGVIIVGHGRYEALQQLGWEIKPEWVIKKEDLTDEQVKAYRLADNKLNESEWDMGLALEELKELSPEMFDLTGFDKDLLIEPDEKDDIIPENVPSRSKLGDLYELGQHRVLCGDSTQLLDIDKLMAGNIASVMFTSPPYNIGKGKMYETYEDDREDEDYINFQIDVINGFSKFLKGIVFWNISYNKNNKDYYIDLMHAIIKRTPFKMRELIAWDKGHGMPITQKNAITRQQEQVMVLDDEENIEWIICADNDKYRPFFKKTQKKLTNYWKIYVLNNTQLSNHLACYPVMLPTKGILLASKENEIVSDPFLGAGSNLIACEKTGRICYGMELDPKYIDVIVQRYVDYTGNENIKLNGNDIIWEKSQKTTK